jgi:hypothetical protein
MSDMGRLPVVIYCQHTSELQQGTLHHERIMALGAREIGEWWETIEFEVENLNL